MECVIVRGKPQEVIFVVVNHNLQVKLVFPFQTGLVVHPTQPWLGGSPDGFFTSSRGTSLLEIKCPFKKADEELIDHQKETSFLRYIKYVDGKLTLLRSHKYYTQVQLLMYICGIQECFFYVYSNKQSVTVVVNRDEGFLCESVRRLEEFYFSWLLPAFAAQRRLQLHFTQLECLPHCAKFLQ